LRYEYNTVWDIRYHFNVINLSKVESVHLNYNNEHFNQYIYLKLVVVGAEQLGNTLTCLGSGFTLHLKGRYIVPIDACHWVRKN